MKDSTTALARPFLIWGSKGHGRVVMDVIHARGGHVVALCDNDAAAISIAPPLPVIVGEAGFRCWLDTTTVPARLAATIAIGGGRGRDREQLGLMLAAHGIDTPPLIDPSASVSPGAAIGPGSQVLAKAVVAAAAALGPWSIVNNSANVDHECRLGIGVHVAPGAVLCGCVTIGDYAFIGAGAVVLPGIHIGRGSTVGAGAVVTKDVAPGDVVIGCPAGPLPNRRSTG